ncbi:CD9 antigen-like isoform X4 [Oncorhynchus kisutch]|uniref:Tetraspanin n=1 Tax=Oncorhynchus kisutch TaxID=8019 RepID=A0A8C7MIP2_ONCKI|nr:CD9 antigen-like isoform X4 [Oncorhynchus kisutch]
MAVFGGIRCVKYIMFIFNVFFWLAGTGVLAIGLWLRFDPKTRGLFEGAESPHIFFTGNAHTHTFTHAHTHKHAHTYIIKYHCRCSDGGVCVCVFLCVGVYILIIAGSFMMVVGFLGCCGAIQESPCMLGLFFFFLLIIFAIEVAAGIWGFSNQSKVVDDITQFYLETYQNYQNTSQDTLRETLRLIQTGLDCCGPTGSVGDFAKDTCPPRDGLDSLITKSCPDAIDEVFDSKLHIIGGVGITIGVIMVFGMIFSMLLCCAIRKSREIV